MRHWLAGLIGLAAACATGGGSAPSAPSVVVPAPRARAVVEAVEPADRELRQRLLALYDQAGFPSVAERDLVLRVRGDKRGRPLCEVGVVLEESGVTRFFRADLVTTYDASALRTVPYSLRATTERPGSYKVERDVGRWTNGVSFYANPIDEPRKRAAGFDVGEQVSEKGHCLAFRPAPRSNEVLHWLGRAAWLRDWGIPDERPLPQGPKLSLEDRVRQRLCRALTIEGERAARAWMPRDHVRRIYDRAMSVCEPEELAAVSRRRTGWQPLDRQGAPGGPELLVRLLEERNDRPDAAQAAGAGWTDAKYLIDPAKELLAIGSPAIEPLLGRARDPAAVRTGGTVGQLSLELLEQLAARRFRSPEEAEAWWRRTWQMTDVQRWRDSLRGPNALVRRALAQLINALGWGALPDLASQVPESGFVVADELAALLDRSPIDSATNPGLHRDVVVLASRLVEAGSADLRFLIELDEQAATETVLGLPASDEEIGRFWDEAVPLLLRHGGSAGRQRVSETLADPGHPLFRLTLDGLHALSMDDPSTIPRSMRARARRVWAADLARSKPLAINVRAARVLARLNGTEPETFAAKVPIAVQVEASRVLVGARQRSQVLFTVPRRPQRTGDAGALVKARVVAPDRKSRILVARWVAQLEPDPLPGLGELVTSFAKAWDGVPGYTAFLVLTRYGGLGTTAWIGVRRGSATRERGGSAAFRDGEIRPIRTASGLQVGEDLEVALRKKGISWTETGAGDVHEVAVVWSS